MKDKKRIFLVCFLYLVGIAVALVYACTNVAYDTEYQIAMGYRLLQGDRLFAQMWEPHQTSAFLCALLMKCFIAITGGTTGIVVYLNACGILIKFLLTLYLYKTMKDSGPIMASISSFMFFIMTAKENCAPEFGNMQVWFSTLVALNLINYFKKKNTRNIVMAALALCLQVLSYPSCVIVYLAGVIVISMYGDDKAREIGIFTFVPVVVGLSYLVHMFMPIGIEAAINSVISMLSVEPTHTVGATDKILAYIGDFGRIWIVLGGCIVAGMLLFLLLDEFMARRKNRQSASLVMKVDQSSSQINLVGYCESIFAVVLVWFLYSIVKADYRGAYTIPMFAIILGGVFCSKALNDNDRRLYWTVFWIDILSFVATLTLTDLPFEYSIPYMLLLVAVSILPIYRRACLPVNYVDRESTTDIKVIAKVEGEEEQEETRIQVVVNSVEDTEISKSLEQDNTDTTRKSWLNMKTVAGVLILLFMTMYVGRIFYIHVGLSGRGNVITPTDTRFSLVRTGPAAGVISDYDGVCKQRDSYKEMTEILGAGDRIWLVGYPVDTLAYLYVEGTTVATPTVMSTPAYNSNLVDYWKINPDKYPTVVAVQSSFGAVQYEILGNEWFMDWLENDYQYAQVVEGNYWTYYFRSER